MGSQYLARLGIVLAVDSGELVQGITAAQKEFDGLSREGKRATNALAKDTQQLVWATEDLGKTLTKVQLLEREIQAGRYKGAEQNAIDVARKVAQAYDERAAAMKKVNGVMTEQQKLQVGYQLTDFFTQVASGQNAMIAFIQQGGQLKDTMGGVGNAFRAVAALITPFRVGMAAIASVVGGLAFSFYKAEKQSSDLRDSLILTGNFAGVTQSQIIALSSSLSDKLSVGYSKVNDVLLALVSSGRYSAQTFDVMSRTILQFSKLSGIDAKEAATKLMGAFDGTAASVRNLDRQYNFLTLAQYRQIEALERQGKAQEAIQLGSKAFLQSIEDQERKLGTLERIRKKLGDAVEYVKNALLSIGRDSDQDKLLDLAKKIERTASSIGGTDTESIANRSRNKQLLEQYTREYTDLARKMAEDVAKVEKESEAKREEARKKELYGRSGGLQASINAMREAQKTEIDAYFKNAMAVATEEERINIELQQKVTEAVIEEYQKNQDTYGFQAAEMARKRVAKVAEAEAEAERKRFEYRKKQQWEADSKWFESISTIGERLDREREKIFSDARNKSDEQKFAREELDLRFSLIGATQKEVEVMRAKVDAQKEFDRLMRTKEFKSMSKDQQTAAKKIYEDTLQAKIANIELAESLQRIQGMYDAVWSNMSSAIENFVRTGKFSIKDFTRSVIQDMLIMQMKLQAMTLVRGLLGSLFSSYSVGGIRGPDNIDVGGGFNPASITPKAIGGPVYGGSPYLVGERGPELFMPAGSGTIIPNNMLANNAGVTNVTNNYINAIDTKSFEQRLLESSNTIWAANTYANKSLATNGRRA